MKPKELLTSHGYAEALEAYKQALQLQPNENYFASMGRAHESAEVEMQSAKCPETEIR